jgi:hypothetical protein
MGQSDTPALVRLSDELGAGDGARGCDNCGKRGPWQTETSSGIARKRMTYELAECHHHPKPSWWCNAGPLWVMHGCGSGCQEWAPLEDPNAKLKDGHDN